MEILMKMTGVCLLGSVVSVLMRKAEPEMAFLSVIAVAVLLSSLLITAVSLLREEAEVWRNSIGVPEAWLDCMLKMMGCSLISGISSKLCLDAGLHTAAYLMECGGTAVGLLLALPVCREMLELVREIAW